MNHSGHNCHLHSILALILSACLALPSPVRCAAASGALSVPAVSSVDAYQNTAAAAAQQEIRVFIPDASYYEQDKDQEASDSESEASRISALKITGVEAPYDQQTETVQGTDSEQTETVQDTDSGQTGAALDTEAKVMTAEGREWEVPVFWLSYDNEIVQTGHPGQDCMPVIAFYVPQEYAVASGEYVRSPGRDAAMPAQDQSGMNADEEMGFMVTLDAFLTGLFTEAGGAACLHDPDTKITYIFAAGMGMSLPDQITADSGSVTGDQNSSDSDADGKKPAWHSSSLPQEMQKPQDGTYDNPQTKPDSDETEHGLSQVPSSPRTQGAPKKEDVPEQDKDPGSPAGPEKPADSDRSEDPGRTDNPSDDQQADPSSPLPPQDLTEQQLLAHVSPRAISRFGEDVMAEFTDTIINCIQPQAVSLLKEKFPAFAQAAENDGLGKEISLYVYYLTGDWDSPAHRNAPTDALAYVNANVDRDSSTGSGALVYMIGINTYRFEARDENYRPLQILDTSEQAIADLDNTLIHEMLHAFMFDYNRTGSIGTTDPADYFRSASEINKSRETYLFPGWFTEGLASCVENNYQFRYEDLQLLRYTGAGSFADRYTKEGLLKAFTTTDFTFGDGTQDHHTYPLDDPDESTESLYVTGYLACLYLGEMAAQYENLGSSVSYGSGGGMDGSSEDSGSMNGDSGGGITLSSEIIRMGLNSVIARLHRGECLDRIIQSISGGHYQDTADFERKFIRGEQIQGSLTSDSQYSGDESSLGFCVNFLNYMLDIASSSSKIPNGSILFGFDEDYTTPIAHAVRMSESNYVITDSSVYVPSTVTPPVPYTDGGKSAGAGAAGAEAAGAEAAGAGAAGAEAAEDMDAAAKSPQNNAADDMAASTDAAEDLAACTELTDDSPAGNDIAEDLAACTESTDDSPAGADAAESIVGDGEPSAVSAADIPSDAQTDCVNSAAESADVSNETAQEMNTPDSSRIDDAPSADPCGAPSDMPDSGSCDGASD